MAGTFEVFVDTESHFRFRLKAKDGTEMAVSGAFDSKAAAVAGIAAVRECAGMGLITDLCPTGALPAGAVHEGQVQEPPTAAPEAGLLPAWHRGTKSAGGFRVPAKTLRRFAPAPRWTGAA
jgi:uncharacterized protein YegP (UPF0339 family)